MKTLLTIILSLIFTVSSFAEPQGKSENEKDDKSGKCPKTMMVKNCLYCHTTPSFKLKESISILEELDLPIGVEIITDGKKPLYFYYASKAVDPDEIIDLFHYMDSHPKLPRKVVIEVHNPGGHVFDGWRVANIMLSYWPKYEIETRLYGMAFSAGFLIFQAGEDRVVSTTAELMWHEVSYYEFLSKITPEGTKEKAVMMRHLQDNANEWLAGRTGGLMTKEELDDKAAGDSGWWFNGQQALEHGFADRLIDHQ